MPTRCRLALIESELGRTGWRGLSEERVRGRVGVSILELPDFDVRRPPRRSGPPRFVVITTTPFAAAVPYSAAADGPFTISMLSISSGLMSLTRLGCAPPVKRLELPTSAVIRMPSMTKIGSLLRLIDATPRMRVRLPEPVCVPVVTTRFDVRAAIRSDTVVIGELWTVCGDVDRRDRIADFLAELSSRRRDHHRAEVDRHRSDGDFLQWKLGACHTDRQLRLSEADAQHAHGLRAQRNAAERHSAFGVCQPADQASSDGDLRLGNWACGAGLRHSHLDGTLLRLCNCDAGKKRQ